MIYFHREITCLLDELYAPMNVQNVSQLCLFSFNKDEVCSMSSYVTLIIACVTVPIVTHNHTCDNWRAARLGPTGPSVKHGGPKQPAAQAEEQAQVRSNGQKAHLAHLGPRLSLAGAASPCDRTRAWPDRRWRQQMKKLVGTLSSFIIVDCIK